MAREQDGDYYSVAQWNGGGVGLCAFSDYSMCSVRAYLIAALLSNPGAVPVFGPRIASSRCSPGVSRCCQSNWWITTFRSSETYWMCLLRHGPHDCSCAAALICQCFTMLYDRIGLQANAVAAAADDFGQPQWMSTEARVCCVMNVKKNRPVCTLRKSLISKRLKNILCEQCAQKSGEIIGKRDQ